MQANTLQTENLGGRTAHAIAWTGIGRVSIQAIQFGSMVVLARILSPTEYGLYSAILVFALFGQVVAQSGLAQAIVQSRNPTQVDHNTAFWMHLALSFALFLLMGASGHFIADFYNQPALASLSWLVGLNYILNIGIIPMAILERKLAFRRVAVVEISATIVGAVVGIATALAGAGAASLALQQCAISACTTIGMWLAARWRPTGRGSRRSAAELFHYAKGVLLAAVFSYWSRNADNMIVGRHLGPGALGNYSRAYQLMMLPTTQITWVLTRVMLPALGAVKSDAERLRAAYLRSASLIAYITMPFALAISVMANDIVLVLFGKAWAPAGGALTYLALASVFQGVGSTFSWLFQVQNRTTAFWWWTLITGAGAIASFIVGVQFGITGVAKAYAVVNVLFLPPAFYMASRLISDRPSVMYSVCFRPLLIACLTALVMLLVRESLGSSTNLVRLVAMTATGLGAFAVLNLGLKTPVVDELRFFLRHSRAPASSN